jgi:hypothetical protein
MSITRKLNHLYTQIPAFECKPGCTDCCGPVPFSRTEWQIITDKRKGTSIDCPYSMTGKCDIYAQRPFMCRIFGTSDDPRLKCPHGCKPLTPLSSDEAKILTDQYLNLFDK